LGEGDNNHLDQSFVQQGLGQLFLVRKIQKLSQRIGRVSCDLRGKCRAELRLEAVYFIFLGGHGGHGDRTGNVLLFRWPTKLRLPKLLRFQLTLRLYPLTIRLAQLQARSFDGFIFSHQRAYCRLHHLQETDGVHEVRVPVAQSLPCVGQRSGNLRRAVNQVYDILNQVGAALVNALVPDGVVAG